MFPPAAASTLKLVTLLVKVAVSDCVLLLTLKVHGDVVPVHVVVPPPTKEPLQPEKTESAFGVAVIVPCWLLSTERLQVAVQEVAFGRGLKLEKLIVPAPVPAKVIFRFFAAATYGPTNGPPPPTGGAPAGWTKSVPVSASARAMFMRPLPLWSCVPAGSAMRARRPTMMPFVSVGSTAFMNAAAPATIAADADVPLMMV